VILIGAMPSNRSIANSWTSLPDAKSSGPNGVLASWTGRELAEARIQISFDAARQSKANDRWQHNAERD
jgi:hypothetical protein